MKDKFESHPVVWGLGLLFVGSVAGYGFNETITEKAAHNVPKEVTSPKHEVSCSIEGLEKLTESHHIRVSALQTQLMKHESGASDSLLIPSYRQNHQNSAERIRSDIQQENTIYKDSVSSLEKKCK